MEQEQFDWKIVKRSTNFRRKIRKIYCALKDKRPRSVKTKKTIILNKYNGKCYPNSASSSIVFPHEKLIPPEYPIQSLPNEDCEAEISVNNIIAPSQQHDYDGIGGSDDEEHNLVDTEFEKNEIYATELRKWAIQFNIKQKALKRLFQICNKRNPNSLPKDPRTLLQTPTVTTIQPVGLNGRYWHQGLVFCLQQCFANINQALEISININIDGLPIYRSSREEFWPILFNIHEKPCLAPMVIGIYSGKGKPLSLELFIRPFVDEMKEVLANGVIIKDQHKISVKIRSFICDSPARAFIKGVTNFNGQHGCQKCTTVGEYSYVTHCNIFPRIECTKRTDEEFRKRIYDSHHKISTPLEELPGLDMVDNFPVADSLHLIDLGIMKKLLVGWRDGKFNNFRTKWCAREIHCISQCLENIKMPSEMHRAVRGLDCLAHWKALEYRTFLYYIGPVILKSHLPYDVYQHFLVFFCAVTICSSTAYSTYLDLAHTLFLHFIEYYRDIYGEEYITSNVHNLSHVVDDVKKLGILSTFSAYPFESKLYQIKNMLRNGSNALVQVARRLTEFSHLQTESTESANDELPALRNNVVQHMNGFILSPQMWNKWFLTNENKVVCMKNTILSNKETSIFGASLQKQENFFERPICSSFLNIYVSDCKENAPRIYSLKEIKCKLVSVKYGENSTVFFPLLHTTK